MKDFTGNIEAVITVHSPEALGRWIKFVSVRASEIGSKSSKAGSGNDKDVVVPNKQDEFVKEIQDQKATSEAEEWDTDGAW